MGRGKGAEGRGKGEDGREEGSYIKEVASNMHTCIIYMCKLHVYTRN